MDALRHRLLFAMGLLPAVSLSLQGCEVSSAPESAPPAPEPGPTTIAPEATLPELAPPETAVDPETPVDPAPPVDPVTYTPVLTTRNERILHPGHVAIFELSAWAPHTDVRLVTIDDATQEVVLLATARTDAHGTAELRFLVPLRAPTGERTLYLETPALVAVATLPLEQVAPTFPNVAELHAGIDDATFADGQRWRACLPSALYAPCPDPADFHPWQVNEIVGYALGRALPPTQPMLECAPVDGFADSCCYLVASWEAGTPQPRDACGLGNDVQDTGFGGGWGGGGGAAAGRPFRVDEQARLAPAVASAEWSVTTVTAAPPADLCAALAESWVRMGQAEHASVASFARFTLELLALGAPADLVARASAAQADEVRHATLCFGLASRLGGQPVGPGPLSMAGALDHADDLHHIVRAAVIEGCIQETISAAQVQRAAERTADPMLAAQLSAVAEDETRHAELSWAFVRWALATHPELHATVAAAFEAAPAAPAGPDREDLAAYGVLSAREEAEVARQIERSVIGPCARALLDAERACA